MGGHSGVSGAACNDWKRAMHQSRRAAPLDALRALSDALGSNNPPAIRAATDRLTDANSKVQALVGTNGARINEMEGAKTSLDMIELNLKTALTIRWSAAKI